MTEKNKIEAVVMVENEVWPGGGIILESGSVKWKGDILPLTDPSGKKIVGSVSDLKWEGNNLVASIELFNKETFEVDSSAYSFGYLVDQIELKEDNEDLKVVKSCRLRSLRVDPEIALKKNDD